jgi:hypothetical protein
MKAVKLFLLVCVLAGMSLAQEVATVPPPPDLEIHFAYVGQRTTTFLDTKQVNNFPQISNATNPLAYRPEISGDPLRTRQDFFYYERQRLTSEYAYLRVRNSSARTIKLIEWDVPHLHIKSKALLTRHTFRSKVQLAPGEMAKIEKPMPRANSNSLRMTALSGPAGTFDLSGGGVAVIQSGDNTEPPFDTITYAAKNGLVFQVPANWRRSGISVNRIEYADGSVWQR